jgi:hypothetical protein
MSSARQPSETDVLNDACLSAQDMAYMNDAREEFKQLNAFVREVLIPAVGGYRTELGTQLDAKLHNIQVLTSNFCWKHRHLGALNEAQEVRHA